MLSIFICEDNPQQRAIIEENINNVIMIEALDMKIGFSSKNPHKLLDYLQSNSVRSGIYFLDVNLNTDINGIELGSMIRRLDPNGKIVFITSYSELAGLTFKYKIEALDYILKDESESLSKKIHDVLVHIHKQLLSKNSESDKLIRLKVGSEIKLLPVDEIIYAETSRRPHRLIIHLQDGFFEFYGKINEFEKLSNHFYRVHKSYVVNIFQIQNVDTIKKEVQMKNADICFLSYRKTKGLLDTIMKK